LGVIAIVLETKGLLCPSSFSLAFGNAWVQLVKFVSTTLATYFVGSLYYIIRKDLKDTKSSIQFQLLKVFFLISLQDILLDILVHFEVIKPTTYWSTANIKFGINALAINVEMFVFCLIAIFAFPYTYFVKPNDHTSTLRAAIDAFNILDLWTEVWKNVKWLFLAVILRRPYIRNPEDARFDIFDAVNGRRDASMYGDQEAYSMLYIPERNYEDEVPRSLLPRDGFINGDY
jgi:hypothetical protein